MNANSTVITYIPEHTQAPCEVRIGEDDSFVILTQRDGDTNARTFFIETEEVAEAILDALANYLGVVIMTVPEEILEEALEEMIDELTGANAPIVDNVAYHYVN